MKNEARTSTSTSTISSTVSTTGKSQILQPSNIRTNTDYHSNTSAETDVGVHRGDRPKKTKKGNPGKRASRRRSNESTGSHSRNPPQPEAESDHTEATAWSSSNCDFDFPPPSPTGSPTAIPSASPAVSPTTSTSRTRPKAKVHFETSRQRHRRASIGGSAGRDRSGIDLVAPLTSPNMTKKVRSSDAANADALLPPKTPKSSSSSKKKKSRRASTGFTGRTDDADENAGAPLLTATPSRRQLKMKVASNRHVVSHSLGKHGIPTVDLNGDAFAPPPVSATRTSRKKSISMSGTSDDRGSSRHRRSILTGAAPAAREHSKRSGRRTMPLEGMAGETHDSSLPAKQPQSSGKARRRRSIQYEPTQETQEGDADDDGEDRDRSRRSKSRTKTRSKSKARKSKDGADEGKRRKRATSVSAKRNRSPSRRKRSEAAMRAEEELEKSPVVKETETENCKEELKRPTSANTTTTASTTASASTVTGRMGAESRSRAPQIPRRQLSVEDALEDFSPLTDAGATANDDKDADMIKSLQDQLSDMHHRVREVTDRHRQDKTDADKIRAELIHLKIEHQKSKSERLDLALELEQSESTINEKNRKIEVLEKAVESQLDQVDELTMELERANEDVADLEDQIAGLEEKMDETSPGESQRHQQQQNDMDDRQRRLDQYEQELEDREDALKMKETYMANETIQRQQEEIEQLRKQLQAMAGGDATVLASIDAQQELTKVKATHASDLQKKDDTIAFLKLEVEKSKSGDTNGDARKKSNTLVHVATSKYESERQRNRMLEEDIEHWKSVNCDLENDLDMYKAEAAEWRHKYERATAGDGSIPANYTNASARSVMDDEMSQRSGIGKIWNRFVTPQQERCKSVAGDLSTTIH